jgi:predicted Zn finger-like uncharacterized protein
MRLICPNCGAQYEVDDSLIPDAGRDVQCSNCGHAWFQQPAHLDAGLSEELGLEPARPVPAPAPPAAPTEPRRRSQPPLPEDEAPAPAPPLPPRQPLDPTVRSILAEEGAREAQARRGEPVVETQGDLGLAEGRGSGARERMARLRGLDADDRAEGAATALAAATAAGSRRDLLPDIEEINSSLRPADERGDVILTPEAGTAPRRSGFGVGFMLVVLAAVIGVGVYILADRLKLAVPATAGAIDAYVAWADGMRFWLEGLAQDWVARLSRMVDSVKADQAG